MQSSWISYKQSIINSTYVFDGIDKMVCLCKYWYALLKYFNGKTDSRTPLYIYVIVFIIL